LIEQSLTSQRHILGHFGDGGVTAESARTVATVRAHSVCGVE